MSALKNVRERIYGTSNRTSLVTWTKPHFELGPFEFCFFPKEIHNRAYRADWRPWSDLMLSKVSRWRLDVL